jgi:alanine racemase
MSVDLLRHTRYVVDLDAVVHNFRQVKAMIASPAAPASKGLPAADPPPKIAAVLKADAYGLGAVPVARVLVSEGADILAVACLPEAIELRQVFPDVPILVMGHTPSEYFSEAVMHRITCTIFDREQAVALSDAGHKLKVTATAHIKVDTGMNRLGLKPGDFGSGAGYGSAAALLANMAALPNLQLEGIFTHLALESPASDAAQVALFTRLIDDTAKLGLRFALRHVCDSIGLMRYPEYRFDLVRPGAVLYGVVPLETPLGNEADIRTPFRFSTRISRIRRLEAGEGAGYDYTFRAPDGGTLLATLPVGYADGFKRNLSNNGQVLIRGVRAPVVGLVCMDQCTVDVGAVPGVSEGDEVVLLGGDSKARPEEGIPILEMAAWCKTNRNDVLCSIGRRVPRVYAQGGSL